MYRKHLDGARTIHAVRSNNLLSTIVSWILNARFENCSTVPTITTSPYLLFSCFCTHRSEWTSDPYYYRITSAAVNGCPENTSFPAALWCITDVFEIRPVGLQSTKSTGETSYIFRLARHFFALMVCRIFFAGSKRCSVPGYVLRWYRACRGNVCTDGCYSETFHTCSRFCTSCCSNALTYTLAELLSTSPSSISGCLLNPCPA